MEHDCKYENQWDRVFDKLDKVSDDLQEINTTMVKNTESLNEHMKRTALLEASLKPIRRAYDSIIWVAGIVVFALGIWKFFL